MQVAVVTGGATGIGAALAHRLADRGWRCVLVGRREDRLQAAAEKIDGEYEVCDVGDREAVEQMAASVRGRHPKVSLLVNNAGMPGRGDFLDMPPERIEQLVRTNYLGSVWCLLAFLPALEAAAPAHLVNVVSVAGTVAIGPYSASKHAQLAFSRSVARELRPRGVHVHTVNPGFVHTEGFPQDWLMRGRLGRIVVGPDFVADRILSAIERNRGEIFVPRWYRVAALAQAALPGTFRRAPSSADPLNRYSQPPPRFKLIHEVRTRLSRNRDDIASPAALHPLFAPDELEGLLARRDFPAARSSSTSSSSRPISGPGGRPSSSPRSSGSGGSFSRAARTLSACSVAPTNTSASSAHGSVSRRKR